MVLDGISSILFWYFTDKERKRSMSRIEKNLAASEKRISELENKIKEDTKTLSRLKMEHEKLQAKQIAEFTKSQNIEISDNFFEMMALVNQMKSEGITPGELSALIGSKNNISKENTLNETKI